MPSNDHCSSESQVIDALEEYLAAIERSEAIPEDEFLEKYPQHRDELKRCLESLNFIKFASQEYEGSTEPRYKRIGDFQLIDEVGRGGMGVVYEAEQLSLNRRVALKVLPFASVLDPRRLERFQNEARAAGSLHHPNIVPVFAVGCHRGVHYYAMELVTGHSLATLIESTSEVRKRGLESNTVSLAALSTDGSASGARYSDGIARLAKQAAEAFSYAHSKGIIHRDIKPSNLLVDERGTLRIADFGLAQFVEGDGVSMTGDVLGTLRYMSPEQAEGRKLLDERTDIYSLGITIYELLTLTPAFDQVQRQELLHEVMVARPCRPTSIDKAIPNDLETIVLKATAKEPESRYDSMQELADDLSRFLDRRPIKARRVSWHTELRSWMIRNPVLASSIGISVALLAAIAVISMLAAKRQTGLARVAEDSRQEVALLQAATKRNLYASDMLVAQQWWEGADVPEALRLLRRHVPYEEGDEDLRGFEWYHLWRKCHNFRFVRRFEHLNPPALVYDVEFLGKDQLLTRHQTKISIWDRQSGQLSRTFSFEGWPHDSILTNDNKSVIASTYSGNLVKQDLSDAANRVWVTAHRWPIHQITRGPAGTIATAGWDGGVKLWTEQLVSADSDDHEYYGFVSLSPDQSHVLTSTEGLNCFVMREAAPGGEQWQSPDHPDRVRFARFSPDSQFVVSINDGDNLPRVWDAEARQLLHVLDSGDGLQLSQWHCAFDFAPNAPLLATAMTDGRIRIWDYVSGKWIEDIRGHGRAVSAVAFSPDGNVLASTSNDGSAILWDMTKTPLNATLDSPVGWGWGLAFSPDGRFVAAGGNEIKVWEWPSLRSAPSRPGGRWPHFAQGGNVLSATSNHTGDRPGDTVRIFFPDGKTSILDTGGDTIRCIAFSPNGKRLVTVGHEKTVTWDVPSSKPLWDLQQLSISADVSPNASVVAIGGIGSLRLHDLETGSLLVQSAALPDKGFCCVRYSRSGKSFATAAWDGTIQIWNADNLSLERQIVGHANFVNSLAFSPEGERLASASSGGDVRLWDTSTGDLTAAFRGSLSITGNPARGLAFSPDGTALLSATSEGQIRIWRAATSRDMTDIP